MRFNYFHYFHFIIFIKSTCTLYGLTCNHLPATYMTNENILLCLTLTRLPAAVPADGNCLFHTLSTAFAGDTSLSTELRVRTCIEMAINEDLYVKKHQKSGIKLASPDYPIAVRECAKDHKFSSVWTIDAAASVLQTKMVSVYPPVNGMLDKTVSILHTTFNPNKHCLLRPPIFVMWSSCSLPRTGVLHGPLIILHLYCAQSQQK